MYPSPDKTKQTIASLDKLNSLDKLATLDEQTNKVIAVSYPLSFLLLESEEDSFVRGYN